MLLCSMVPHLRQTASLQGPFRHLFCRTHRCVRWHELKTPHVLLHPSAREEFFFLFETEDKKYQCLEYVLASRRQY